MQKHLLYIPLIALSSALALTACSDEVTNTLTPDLPIGEKTPIELSVGGVDSPNAATRAVITDGTGKTLNAFDKDTKIFMVMKSEYDTDHPDFAGAQNPKYNVARGDVSVSNNDATKNWSIVDFDAKNQRYWDDAHARSTMLSIYAYAQQGQSNWNNCTFDGKEYKTAVDETQPYAWTTTEIVPTILTWRASHQDGTEAQNSTSVLAQDLLFSNNLANYGTDKDKRLKFDFSTRKFPKVGEANMIFYHAMSKIVIKIVEGDGFDKTAKTDFQFTTVTTSSNKNLILKGFNHTGKFDIVQGEFTEIASNGTTDIPSICLASTTPDESVYYTLEALTIPSIANNGKSRFVKDAKSLTDDVMIEFAIDNNKFQITSGLLYNALHADGDPSKNLVANATEKSDNGKYIPLEAGKKYVFTFTVGKTQIKNITAQVVGWEDVVADEFDASNARIKLQLEERGTSVTVPVDIYRAEDNPSEVSDTWESYKWTTGYVGNKNVFKEVSGAWKLENDWFWDNNMTFYHFRAVIPSGQTVQTDATPDPKEDYVSLSSAVNYTYVLWGAPMRDVANNETADNFKFIYDKDAGFDVKNSAVDASKSQIYQAIGPTEDKLKLTLFHMMSDVTFKIKTTTGADKVNLGTGAGTDVTTIKLEKIHKEGKLYMGNGLVKGSDDPSGFEFTSSSSAPDTDGFLTWPHYGAIPQSLENVVLVITTPDHNQYKVAMKDVLAKTISSNNLANPYKALTSGDNSGKYPIDRWYPGFKYTYTFTLKKTGITDLQVTILDWETVEAGNQDVVIQ